MSQSALGTLLHSILPPIRSPDEIEAFPIRLHSQPPPVSVAPRKLTSNFRPQLRWKDTDLE